MSMVRRHSSVAGPLSKLGGPILFARALSQHNNTQRSAGHAAGRARPPVACCFRPGHRIDHASDFTEHSHSDGHDKSGAERNCSYDQGVLRHLIVIHDVAADGREDGAAGDR